MKSKIMLVLGLVLAGCVPCWNPLYTEADLVFEAGLLGTWKPIDPGEASQEAWTFSKNSERVYKLEHTDSEGQKAEFEARLVKLGQRRFLDLYLSSIDSDQVKLNSLAIFALAPAHLILRLEQLEPTLKVAVMDPGWIRDFVKKNPEGIAHRRVVDDGIVLTASTSELQKFFLKHGDDEGFFGGPMELKK